MNSKDDNIDNFILESNVMLQVWTITNLRKLLDVIPQEQVKINPVCFSGSFQDIDNLQEHASVQECKDQNIDNI